MECTQIGFEIIKDITDMCPIQREPPWKNVCVCQYTDRVA